MEEVIAALAAIPDLPLDNLSGTNIIANEIARLITTLRQIAYCDVSQSS
jgi:hypothetical protein